MWERTLQDLVRGLRANKKDEAKFIAQAVDEIRKEVKSKDMEIKAGAVLKLTYLNIMGYDMNWASFHVVEVMSSPRPHLKAVGYLAASQSFQKDTDVLMLTTNLLKKDLSSTPTDIAIALNGLSQFLTLDLARDLWPYFSSLLNHSRPIVRKRATLALYKVMVNYPEACETGVIRLREKLEDTDPGVVAATVNVLCEYARSNPHACLELAPPLFHLLTTSSNNWMLIKIVKLFGSLTPHEPRLVKKLHPPLSELIATTPAISLLYECVHTSIIGNMLQGAAGDSLARLCVSKLAAFIEDEDQNLKYFALLAMEKIAPSHPHLIIQYQDVFLSSIGDDDISIRMRALDLVSVMVDRHNVQSIVQQLLSHLVLDASSYPLPSAAHALAQLTPTSPKIRTLQFSPSQSSAYRLVLAKRILNICAQGTYENVTNFEWYLSVLVDLAHVAKVDVGLEIRDHLVDVVGRVKGARRYAVKLMTALLSDENMLRDAQEEGSCSEVLWAAAWICGEYCSEVADPQSLILRLLQPEVTQIAPETLAMYIQATMKVFGHWAAELAQRWDDDQLLRIKQVVTTILTRVGEFVSHPHVEVQERAANTVQLFALIQADLNAYRPRSETELAFLAESTPSFGAPLVEPNFPKSLYLIRPLSAAYELNPVAETAQASVPIPEGLDLDAWIVPPSLPPDLAGEGAERRTKKDRKGKGREVNGSIGKQKRRDGQTQLPPELVGSETAEELAERERRKAERIERMRDDPYYIVDDRPSKAAALDDIDAIPVVHLVDLLPPPIDPGRRTQLASLGNVFPSSSPQTFVVEKGGEMPRGAQTPDAGSSGAHTPVHLAPVIAPYDVEQRPHTPDPIKVTRAKKKGASSKRTPKLAGAH